MSALDDFLREKKGVVAVVSTAVPPDPSGQARVLEVLLRGVPGSRIAFLTSSAIPAGARYSQSLYVLLSAPTPLMTTEVFPGYNEAEPDNPREAVVRLNNTGGWLASLERRAGEIQDGLAGRDVAVIVACSGDPIDILACAIAAERMSVPFVTYLFDDPIFQWEDEHVLRPLAQFAEPLWVRRTSLVITPNEILAEDLRERNADGIHRMPEIRIVRNPCPAEGEVEARPWPASHARPVRIVYTGSVYHAQADAFRNLIQAFSLCANPFELHIYSPQGKERLESENISGPQVFFHGYVPSDVAADVQRDADILFLPLSFSRIQKVIRSSSPFKAGEYLNSGRPVLVHAPDGAWVAEFFQGRACGAVVAHPDVAALAATLDRIVADRAYRDGLFAAQQREAADFRWRQVHQTFWSLLRTHCQSVDLRQPLNLSLAASRRPPRSLGGRETARTFDERRPRILFVAMQNSPHTARWIEMIADRDWDLHLFPLDNNDINPAMCGVTVHRPQLSPGRVEDIRILPPPAHALGTKSPAIVRPFRAALSDIGGPDALRETRVSLGEAGETAPLLNGPGVLAALIRKLKPDIIHSMEFQHAGYLVSKARENFDTDFPPWLATNWGSDIFYFSQFEPHRLQIERLLSQIDYYSCECHRDIKLARKYGYRGPVLRVLPNTGGFDIGYINGLRTDVPTSHRKRIMVKGYQHFAGRALTALAVLESIAGHLKDYEIVLYSLSSETIEKAKSLIDRGVLNIKIIGWATHHEMLTMFESARIYLGVSISDAISTSVLEAMAMGTFPIQTNTSCCDEWFMDGEGGFIVSPYDEDQIRSRVLAAISDDALVDRAAEINRRTVERRLARDILAPQIAEFYQPILDDLRIKQTTEAVHA